MEEVAEYRAARFFKRVVAIFLCLLVIVFGFLYIDRPVNTKYVVRGEVVSIGVVQKMYRSLNAASLATIKLEDGSTLYRKMSEPYVGQPISVKVYVRRFTKIKSYKL